MSVRKAGRETSVSTSLVILDAHSMVYVSRASATVIKDGKENIALLTVVQRPAVEMDIVCKYRRKI